MSTKLFCTHHSPTGAWSSLTFGHPDMGLSIDFEDHVKNTSFLMDRDGHWSLSPAYDVTFAYDKEGKFTNSHQMLINGKIREMSGKIHSGKSR